MQKFVKKVTETIILETIDGAGPDGSIVSIVPAKKGNHVELVIGSMYINAYAPAFTKGGLRELIYILQEVHDAMK